MERTLDDSAIRRLALPQAFLGIDACLIIYRNISDGMVVYPNTIAAKLNEELPFMATEEIMMAGVKAGGDRQDLHESIRQHSVEAAAEVKERAKPNDLIARLKNDPLYDGIDLDSTLDPMKYIGRAPEQVDEFIAECVDPVREGYAKDLGQEAEDLRV